MYREEKISIAVLSVLLSLGPFAHSTVGFRSAQSYPVGTNPVAGKAADFNGDGKLDLAVLNSGSTDVSILLANGDGTFQLARTFGAGNSPSSIAVGDFNGDGKMDLAVFMLPGGTPVSPLAGEIRILLGNGDGTLQTPKVTTLDVSAIAMAAGDFNGDKKTDLVVSNFVSGDLGFSLDLLLGNGDGTFQAVKGIASDLQCGPIAVLACLNFTPADFNKDGKLDLAVAVSGGVQILLGQGNGAFVPGPTAAVTDGFTVGSIQTADFNNDGKLDLIVSSGQRSRNGQFTQVEIHYSVFLGKGDGTFGRELVFATGGSSSTEFGLISSDEITEALTGDFDADGELDIADRRGKFGRLQGSTSVLEIRLGKGDGTFAPNNATLDPTLVLPDAGPLLLAQDLNGDQLADVVATDTATRNAIHVLLNATVTFLMSASETALTAQGGQQVTDTLSLATHNGFSSAIHLSCQVSGPAPLPTCSLSPADIPAGANSSTSTLILNVPTNSAGLVSPAGLRLQPLYALAFPFALLGISRRHKSMKNFKRWLLWSSLIIGTLIFNGCGGGGNNNVVSPPLHEARSYSVVVTAASDTITKTLQIPLTAQ